METDTRLTAALQAAARRANLEHQPMVVIQRDADYRVQPQYAEIPEGWEVKNVIHETKGGEQHDQPFDSAVVRNNE